MPHRSEFIETQYAFTQYLRNPDIIRLEDVKKLSGTEPRRMKIYSDLIYNNIETFVNNNFPVLFSIIDTVVWHKLIRQFIVDFRCQTPIFAEIGHEFIQFLESETFIKSKLSMEIPDFTLELAYYEWMELIVSIDMETIDWKQRLVDEGLSTNVLAKQLKVSNLSKLGSFSYPVQNISIDFIPTKKEKLDTHLLVYRDGKHDINFLSLAPVSSFLYQQFDQSNNLTAEQILENLHEQLNFNNWDDFSAAGTNIILEWIEKDILYY